MTTPKIPKAGRSVMPLKTHTVKSAQGKSYSYRRNKIYFWFNKDEIALLESVFNHIKSTRQQKFSDKELSTLPKFLKAVLMKYSRVMKRKYVD